MVQIASQMIGGFQSFAKEKAALKSNFFQINTNIWQPCGPQIFSNPPKERLKTG